MGFKRQAPVLVLLLILAIASVGVAYGLWADVLHIEGSVETGAVSAAWTKVGCFDNEVLKDVGVTSGEIDSVDPHYVYFRIEKGYPGYEGDCEVELTSTGSIPVHVEAINFLPGAGLTDCAVDQSQTTGSFVAKCKELTITWANGLCTQLHQGDFIGSSLYVQVEQEAEQDRVYEFRVAVELNQFNESSCP